MSIPVKPAVMPHLNRRKASRASMDAMRTEYLAAKVEREKSGKPVYVNSAWCDCPEHRLPACLESRGAGDDRKVVADAA